MSGQLRLARQVRRALGLDWCRPAGMLAVRPGSQVLLLDSSRGRLVAKIGRPEAAAAEAAARAAVGEPRLPLAVPRLVLHDPATGLLVTEHCPGETLADRIRAGDSAAARRAGAALATLQESPPADRTPVGLREHAADLIRPAREQWAGHPLLGDRAARLLRSLLRAEPACVPGRPVHRDLHPRQMLDDGRRTWVLDWEHAAWGDPALDVGNLCGYLRARLEPATAEPAVAAFLAGYADGDHDGALHRAGLYEAFTFLRLACKAARAGRDAEPAVHRLLSLAEQRAAEVGAHVGV